MAGPKTGFEQTGTWTTPAAEAAFLQQVASETAATLTEAGRTVQDRPIHRVDLGTGTAQTLLIVCLQHANEQASREGALQQIRDLAYSTDPAVVSYLATHRIVWMTSVNADRFPTNRNNANNVNLNRDHYRLTQPEAQAIAAVISDAQPNLIMDAHEYFASGSLDNWQGRGMGLPGTPAVLQSLSDQMFNTISDRLKSQGFRTSTYYLNGTARAFLSCAAAAYNTVGFLSETNAINDTMAQRVTLQRDVLGMVQEWHAANSAACTAARQSATQWATTSNGPDTFLVDHEYVGLGTIETASLSGYQTSTPIPAHVIDAFGITVDPNGFVPIKQPARTALPQLLDPNSYESVATATRVAPPAPPEPPLPDVPMPDGEWSGTYVQIGGRLRPVISVSHQTAQGRIPARLP